MRWRIIDMPGIDIYTLHALEDILYTNPSDDNVIAFSKVRPGISIASNENYAKDIDEASCIADSVDVTRRMSGGRSMYLDENYVILSIFKRDHNFEDHPEQYRKILGMVTSAMHRLSGKNYTLENSNDIMVDGKKIGGAAQRNSRNINMVHCYIRVTDDIHKLLKYVMIDGHHLGRYYNEVRHHLACANDFMDTSDFYPRFKDAVIKGLDHYESGLTAGEMRLIRGKVQFYKDMKYVKGHDNYPSKGNCDIIAGSGSKASLKIRSLEGVVKFS
jgi:lipoate---protein ligase